MAKPLSKRLEINRKTLRLLRFIGQVQGYCIQACTTSNIVTASTHECEVPQYRMNMKYLNTAMFGVSSYAGAIDRVRNVVAKEFVRCFYILRVCRWDSVSSTTTSSNVIQQSVLMEDSFDCMVGEYY